MPATWKMYGVDANRDGEKDPYNPVDAIFAAARYLRAAGADTDLRRAIFAYNHADWYVDSVLLRARVIGGLPERPRRLADGPHAGPLPRPREGDLRRQAREGRPDAQDPPAAPTPPWSSSPTATAAGIDIFARKGAPAIAVNDGKVVRIGRTKRLGRFVKLLDVYGNTYTYAHLGKVAKTYPAPKKRTAKRSEIRRELKLDKAPKARRLGDQGARRARRAQPSAPPPRSAASRVKQRLSAARRDGRRAGQGAPVRPPGAPERPRRRRRRPARPARPR